jgi:hypothetical protein
MASLTFGTSSKSSLAIIMKKPLDFFELVAHKSFVTFDLMAIIPPSTNPSGMLKRSPRENLRFNQGLSNFFLRTF